MAGGFLASAATFLLGFRTDGQKTNGTFFRNLCRKNGRLFVDTAGGKVMKQLFSCFGLGFRKLLGGYGRDEGLLRWFSSEKNKDVWSLSWEGGEYSYF